MVGERVPSRHPAHIQKHPGNHTAGGQAIGTQTFQTLCQFIAENIGSPSHTYNPSHIGIQKSVGSFHGARGAQFRGIEIQLPPQNQHESPAKIVSIPAKISSTFPFILSREFMKSSSSSPLTSLLKSSKCSSA